jgi:hypothetical protein
MSNAAKLSDSGDAPLSETADHDVLHFLTRTLQAHTLDAEPRDVLAKLENLKRALDQQEATLSAWPDSASKDRICAALAKAKNVVAQIVDEYRVAVERSAAS